MANFAYGGLRVRVTADTDALKAQIARDATRAGQAAGQEMGKQLGRSVQRSAASVGRGAGKTVSDGLVAAAKGSGQQVGRDFERSFASAGRRAGARVGRMVGTLFGQEARGEQVGRRIGQQIGTGLGRGADAISRVASRAASGFARAFGPTGPAITRTIGDGFRAASGLASRAASAAAQFFTRNLGPAVSGVTRVLGGAFSAVAAPAGRAASAVAQVFGRGASAAGSAITSGLGRAWDAVVVPAGRAAASAGSAFARMASSIGSAITGSVGRAFEGISGLASRAMAPLTGGGGAGGGVAGALTGIVGKLGPMAAGLGGVGVAAAGLLASTVRTGIAYNTLSQTSRAAFTTILGSSQAADQMMDRITRFARSSPFPRQAFIEGARQMVSFGISAERVIPYFTAIQDAVAATGGSAQQLSEITLVMSQIQAAGRITGVDLMQFAQRGINAADLIGRAMGKTGAQIKEEISSGSFDATRALDALRRGMELQYGGAAANVKTTWAGTTDSIKGAMRDIGGAIVAPFIDPKRGGLAVTWGNRLATSLRGAIPAVTATFRVIGQVIAGAARVIGFLFGLVFRIVGPILRAIGRELAPVITRFREVWTELSARFTPAARQAAPAVNVLTRAFTIMGRVVGFIIGTAFKLIAFLLLNVVIPALRLSIIVIANTVTFLVRLGQAVARLGQPIAAVFGWVRRNWPLLAGILTGPIGLAVLGITRSWAALRAATVAVWNAIRAAIAAAWTAIRAVTSAATGWVGSRVASAWSGAVTVTTRSWTAVTGAISRAWANIRAVTQAGSQWVMTRLAQAWGAISRTATAAWTGLVAMIGRVWTGIQEKIAGPVRWVVKNIINRLIHGINFLLDKVGLGKITPIAIPGMAHGGKVPGHGRGDRQIIAAEAGEWMLTRRQARAIGYNTLRNLPHYQAGGIVGTPGGGGPSPRWGLGPIQVTMPNIGGALRSAWDKSWGFTKQVLHLDDIAKLGGEVIDTFSGMLRQAAAAAFKLLVQPLKRAAEGMLKGQPAFPNQWMAKTLISAIDAAVTFIEGKSVADFTGGGAGVDALAAEIMGRFPGLRITSALRPGDTKSYHSRNMARDLGGPVALMNRAGAWIAQNMASALIEGIHNPTLSVKNGARVAPSFWGAGTWAGHADHIHIAAAQGGGAGPAGAGVARWRPLVTQIARMKGIPTTVDAWLRQIGSESGGNANAVQQVRDINWPHNLARGLLQVIPTTFRAQRGNPFGTNIMDPRANIWAAMTYAIKRYGSRLLQVIGRGHGYARGGVVSEHIIGVGQRTGQRYDIGERGRELITPLRRPAPDLRGLGAAAGSGPTINVYPREHQDERQIAAAVSRELAWASAGGRG